MENEPVPPPSSVPPPPDLAPPPPPPSVPPPPDLAPPPPPPRVASTDVPPPPPVSSSPAKFDADDHEEEGGHATGSPEGVKEADLVTRVIACVIDSVAAWVLYLIIAMIHWTLGYLVFAAILLVRDALPFLDGQSPGKRLMKIRAVEENGKKLTNNWAASITRNILLAIPFAGLYEAYILYSKKEAHMPLRRLGDEWAKTKVIVVKDPATP